MLGYCKVLTGPVRARQGLSGSGGGLSGRTLGATVTIVKPA